MPERPFPDPAAPRPAVERPVAVEPPPAPRRADEADTSVRAADRDRAELEAVYHAIADGILVLDMAGAVVFANDAMARLGGYRGPDALRSGTRVVGEATTPFELRTGDGALLPETEWPVARVLRGEPVHEEELEVRRLDTGEVQWISYSAQPVRDRGGAQFQAVIVARDITARKVAERTLRESEERARARAEQLQRAVEELQVVLDTVPAAVWIARDATGDRIDANRLGSELLRRPRGTNVSVTAPLDERPLNFKPMKAGVELLADDLPIQAAARSGRESRGFEFDLLFEDGSVRHLLGNATPLRDEHGEPRGSVGAFIDITDRKRAEEALRGGEEEARARAVLMEAVLDCIADGVIIYDREGRTVRSSPAADEILKVPASERKAPVAGRVMQQYEIFSEDGRRLGPDEMIAVRAAIGGETIRGAINQIRTRGHEPRWLMMNAMPLLVSGEHTGAVLSLTDVTARKRAEAELAVVTRLYAVLSRVNEAIVRTRDERTLFGELCRIVAEEGGFPLVWVGLVNGREVIPEASSGGAVAYLRDLHVEVDGALGQGPTGTCIREDRPVINDDFEVNPATWPWREQTTRYGLRASAAFPLRRRGNVIGAVTFYAAHPGAFTPNQVSLLEALCADVSYALDAIQHERLRTQAEVALRESEQSLREADRRKDEFLSMLSHELRNPLAPIRNSVYVLEHADAASEQARRARTVIERQAEHLTRLVDDLLDVTRIARGKIQLRRRRLDLREAVLGAADDFRALMDERGLEFHIVVPPAKTWIDADPTRITQVVGNLLHNAAKFSRRGDHVTLTLDAAGDVAEIRVRDTGAGIDAALLPRVFEAFVQGERTLARTEGGLGLGLALVKGIAELHGGTVRAESAGTDAGAEFTVQLPALREVAAPEERPGATRRVGGRRVLVVDDNSDAADSLCDLLVIAGHSVDVAHDGPGAVEKARANPPDVVLCDIGLPGMSGYDVARELRRHPALRTTRLVALSGYAQPEDRRRAQDAGFDVHVAKPPDIDELMRLLDDDARDHGQRR